MMKLSFVLPCYNVERYIADCLQSIYDQDLLEDEFEVICVNDCSTDGTRKIIVDYAALHPNLTLIDHTENLTVGGARNTGIKAAKGDYVWFVDPDDKVKSNSAKIVYESAKGKDVDILMFNYEIVNEQNHFLKEDNSFANSEILGGQDFIAKYYPKHFSALCIVWRCLFRLGFLKERGLLYPIMRKAEDVSFLWKVLLVAERVASVSGVYYTYRSNPYSVTKILLDSHVLFSERILFANEIVLMLEQDNISAVVRKEMMKTLRWCVNSNLELLHKMSKEQRKRYYEEIVNNRDVVNRVRPYMNRKQKRVFYTIGGKQVWLTKIALLKWLNASKR
jgi:glycosyltransferase involved in cell wall biosynthesis